MMCAMLSLQRTRHRSDRGNKLPKHRVRKLSEWLKAHGKVRYRYRYRYRCRYRVAVAVACCV
jgi:hypothetical protein